MDRSAVHQRSAVRSTSLGPMDAATGGVAIPHECRSPTPLEDLERLNKRSRRILLPDLDRDGVPRARTFELLTEESPELA